MKKEGLPVIAAFDFDGTLTYRDSLFPFLLFCFGFLKTFLLLSREIPTFIRYLAGRASRQETKERVLTQFFRGMGRDHIQRWGENFAKNQLPIRLKPEAMERLRWHQKKGDRCFLISASLDIYLAPWANRNGFQAALTSRMGFNEEGKATGKLVGLNCRGEEKVRRLTESAGPLTNYILYAYGDSDGDKELLAAADFPFYRQFSE